MACWHAVHLASAKPALRHLVVHRRGADSADPRAGGQRHVDRAPDRLPRYLVNSELERRAAALATPARIVSQASAADRALVTEQMGRLLGRTHARGSGCGQRRRRRCIIRRRATGTTRRGLEGVHRMSAAKDGRYYSAAIMTTNGTTVAALAPITPEFLGNIVPGIGASRIGLEGPFAGVVPASCGRLGQTGLSRRHGSALTQSRWPAGTIRENAKAKVSVVSTQAFGGAQDSLRQRTRFRPDGHVDFRSAADHAARWCSSFPG